MISTFINALVMMFAFLPSWVSFCIIAVFAFTLLVIAFKIVAFVLDALPFI